MRARNWCLAGIACIAVACATQSHVGRWGYDDAKLWRGVMLNGDGSCLIVGGIKGSVGGGGRCRYSVSGDTVTITELFDGTHWSPPPVQLAMNYRKNRDTMTMPGEDNLELSRVSRLFWEP
jgi:hypothetical protein